MNVRDVFHIRLKGLELQAEQIIDPTLKKRPVAIISSNSSNSIIIALSPEAEEEGFSCGMKVSTIRKVNHGVRLLPYNKSLYTKLNKYIYNTVSMHTPIVEPRGIGEFFLDMNGMRLLRGDVQNNGLSILESINNKTRVIGQVGIGSNKLVSQTITTVTSDKIYQVKEGLESQFFSYLDPDILPTASEKSVNKIIKFLLINKIKSLQSIIKSPDEFKILFGVHSVQLAKESHGKDSRPVKPLEEKDIILRQTILFEDTNSKNILDALVKDLAEQIAFELRKRWQLAKKIKVEIHYADGYQMLQYGKVESLDDFSVIEVCQLLFEQANKRRNRIRTILIVASHFFPFADQVTIFRTIDDKNMELSKAIENIRQRYGFNALQTANIFQALGKS
ncbi:MAG: Y-family DNA polymerase [Fidelibacterota bacterium]|jgi:DNA polymerase-4|tara:strand:- start:3218 stop:4390 length:1173 start_codon:yes stop_codon:yes gene_type:complete